MLNCFQSFAKVPYVREKNKENNAVFGKKVLVFARILLGNPSNGNKFGQRRIFLKKTTVQWHYRASRRQAGAATFIFWHVREIESVRSYFI